jgi:hypothetical protein
VSSSWPPVTITSIVEGEGDVAAMPKLLHRIAAELGINGLRTPKLSGFHVVGWSRQEV